MPKNLRKEVYLRDMKPNYGNPILLYDDNLFKSQWVLYLENFDFEGSLVRFSIN